MNPDTSLLFLLHSLAGRSEALDFVFGFLARALPYLAAAAAALALLLPSRSGLPFWKRGNLLIAFIPAIAARFLLTPMIRAVIPRDRPFVKFDFSLLIPHEASSSFPSGHAVFFFALATSVYIRHKRLGVLLFAVAVIIGLARIIAGVHWPSDVVGGALIGVLTSLAGEFLWNRLKHPLRDS